jgi:hypothetical protein
MTMLNFSNSITLQSELVRPARTAADEVNAGAQADFACKWAEWLQGFADWKSMITLTVDNEHHCTRDTFIKRVRWLVQRLNVDLYGNHYTRIYKHSYFSYVVGIELTSAGVIHAHMLVDRPVNYSLVHTLWNKVSGYVWIKSVTEVSGAARYISKYISKRQDLELMHKSMHHKSPAFVPSWYADNL